MDDGQVDFIQTLKRSTISVATVTSDFTPTGGVGHIPLKVSNTIKMCTCAYLCTYIWVCVCVCAHMFVFLCMCMCICVMRVEDQVWVYFCHLLKPILHEYMPQPPQYSNRYPLFINMSTSPHCNIHVYQGCAMVPTVYSLLLLVIRMSRILRL